MPLRVNPSIFSHYGSISVGIGQELTPSENENETNHRRPSVSLVYHRDLTGASRDTIQLVGWSKYYGGGPHLRLGADPPVGRLAMSLPGQSTRWHQPVAVSELYPFQPVIVRRN